MNGSILYGIAVILLIISLAKSRDKTKRALLKAGKSALKLAPTLIPMMIMMGAILAIVNAQFISRVFGSGSGVYGVILGLVLGAVAFVPSFVAFPLGANLLQYGAGYPQVAGFISTLMAVGFISFGVESKYFGVRTSIIRNLLGLFASIVFVILIWGLM
jgi:uncharacterized membrane protein YraQ (UPF0718 family)